MRFNIHQARLAARGRRCPKKWSEIFLLGVYRRVLLELSFFQLSILIQLFETKHKLPLFSTQTYLYTMMKIKTINKPQGFFNEVIDRNL